VVKLFRWNKEKDLLLKKQRGIGFELAIEAINNHLLDVYDHPNQQVYPKQKIYVIEALGYVYLVPFIRVENDIFLKLTDPHEIMQHH
jgi:hypothetical protein